MQPRRAVISQLPTAAPEADEAAAEAAKQERRLVLANNKAWRAAELVRREWLATFVTRKTAPKDAMRFMAVCLAHGDFAVVDAIQKGNRYGASLLGIDLTGDGWYPDRQPLLDAVDGAADGRLPVMALVLGALQAWGYELSDMEQPVVTGDAK